MKMKRNRFIVALIICAMVFAAGMTGLTMKASAAQVGDSVNFGNYNGEQLNWKIVATDGTYATLLLNDVLRDGTANDENMLLKQFHSNEKQSGAKNWAASPLKTFLNGTFYDTAFSADEKAAILNVNGRQYPGIVSADSDRQGEKITNPAAGDCKVFVPAYGELRLWFSEHEQMQIGDYQLQWWLRSPVDGSSTTQTVWYAHEYGYNRAITSYYLSVRPVIVVSVEDLNIEITANIRVTTNAGAKIELLDSAKEKVAETTADGSGAAVFEALQLRQYTIKISLSGYRTYEQTVVLTGAGLAIGRINLTLITYRLTGVASSGASVELYRAGVRAVAAQSAERVFSTKADASGNYSITGIAPGEYTLKIAKLGFYAHEQALTIADDTVLGTITLAAVPETYKLSGKTTPGADVKLLEGQTVLAEIVADAEGEYEFEGVPDSAYTLEISMAGYKTEVLSVTVAGDNAVLNNSILKKFYKVIGSTNLGASVKLYQSGNLVSETVSQSGDFSFADITNGSYKLVISLENYKSSEVVFAVDNADANLNSIFLAPDDVKNFTGLIIGLSVGGGVLLLGGAGVFVYFIIKGKQPKAS